VGFYFKVFQNLYFGHLPVCVHVWVFVFAKVERERERKRNSSKSERLVLLVKGNKIKSVIRHTILILSTCFNIFNQSAIF
jgi:hypothetical protein